MKKFVEEDDMDDIGTDVEWDIFNDAITRPKLHPNFFDLNHFTVYHGY